MGRFALVGGSSFLGADAALPFAARAERVDVSTRYGPASVLDGGEVVVLQRHGLDRYVPPDRIDHRSNFAALAELGCDRVLAVSSVGSLDAGLPVGAQLCPDDFIALQLGYSVHDDARGHRVPSFDAEWRAEVLAAWTASGLEPPRDGGVYWQAIGPRFETPAEVRLIAAHADVIGMTVASECIVAGDLGIAYAVVCVVDNLASGLGPLPLTAAEFEAGRAANRAPVLAALGAVLPNLAGIAA